MTDARDRSARVARTRAVSIAPADTAVRYGGDGTVFMLSRRRLGAYPNSITERLEHWAVRAPDRTFLAQRDDTGSWRRISYAETLTRVRRREITDKGTLNQKAVLQNRSGLVDQLYAPVASARVISVTSDVRS
jgi:hypothetical protein